jgi:phage-related protein
METRPKLKDELINVLKNMQTIGQGLTPIVQPIIRGIFECWTFEIFKDFKNKARVESDFAFDQKLYENPP